MLFASVLHVSALPSTTHLYLAIDTFPGESRPCRRLPKVALSGGLTRMCDNCALFSFSFAQAMTSHASESPTYRQVSAREGIGRRPRPASWHPQLPRTCKAEMEVPCLALHRAAAENEKTGV